MNWQAIALEFAVHCDARGARNITRAGGRSCAQKWHETEEKQRQRRHSQDARSANKQLGHWISPRRPTGLRANRSDTPKCPQADRNTIPSTCAAKPGSAGVSQSLSRDCLPHRPASPVMGKEQTRGTRLVMADGHSSPLPPCLAGHVGRSRYADRLRPDFFLPQIFFLRGLFAAAMPLRRRDPNKTQIKRMAGTGPATHSSIAREVLTITAWPDARLACARAAAPCVRRTAPGSPPRTRPRLGTAWRSERPAPAAVRSGNVQDTR